MLGPYMEVSLLLLVSSKVSQYLASPFNCAGWHQLWHILSSFTIFRVLRKMFDFLLGHKPKRKEKGSQEESKDEKIEVILRCASSNLSEGIKRGKLRRS